MMSDLENRSLIGVLEDSFNLKCSIFEDELRIVYPSSAEAALLGVSEDTPLLGVFERVRDADGNLIYVNDEIIVSSLYTYKIRYKT